MSHCVQCIHWDRESAEDNLAGLGICEHKTGWFDHPSKHFSIARTRGDDTCDSYSQLTGQSSADCGNLSSVSDGTAVSDVPETRRA